MAVFFADLRGSTSSVDGVEPEELQRVLREFHDTIGRLVQRFEATIGLITQRLYAEVEDSVEAVSAGEFVLKGFGRPVPALDVVALREAELTEA